MEQRKALSAALPLISRSADGYLYPVIAMVIYLLSPEKAAVFIPGALAAFMIELTVYKALKKFLKRSRPFEVLQDIKNRRIPPDKFSFPSGHTAAAFCMVSLISYFFPALFIPAFTWALLVGISRIYLGLHYPTDIIAGIILGMLSAVMGLGITG